MGPVLLVNPNGSEATTAAMVAIAEGTLNSVQGWTNTAAPEMLTSPEPLEASARDIVRLEIPEGTAGVIIAAFGDPGLAALAARAQCPVVGIGASAARAAAKGGARFAVATTTPLLGPSIDALMRQEGGEGSYLGSFMTMGDPQALVQDMTALDAALIGACRAAATAGAERIIIGGGPLAQAAQRIGVHVSVPLIQPLPEACRALLRDQSL